MPGTRKYAVVFANDMIHPLYIVCENWEDFFYKLRDIMQKYGDIELVYRVY